MDATVSDPLLGRLLDGRYEVADRVARGGMATVYRAVDHRLGRDVALKILYAHLAEDDGLARRFEQEARAAARLSHPNVVQVFDQGEEEGLHYLAMEFLPGRTLRKVLVARGALTPRETFTVADPVLDALAAAHRSGIVHRDVKPENVILTDDGRVKVADFGLARAADAATVTSGAVLGTVAYLAPEIVAHGAGDARSDVYAAGVMLFEMLTGRQPFIGDVPAQVAYRHVHEDVPAPSSLVPGLPEPLDDLVLAATARDPDERPRDAGVLLTMLRAARRLVPVEALDVRPAVTRRSSARANGTGTGAGAEPAGAPTQLVAAGTGRPTEALPGSRRSVPAASPGSPAAGWRQAPAEGLEDLARERRARGVLAFAMVLVAAVLVGGGAWWLVAGPGRVVPVPDLRNVAQAQAVADLRSRGLKSDVRQVYSETVALGRVVGTDPPTGQDARKGSTVVVQVSRGPQLFDVPTLAGKKQDDATAALRAAHLDLGTTTEQYSDTVPTGAVISSTPAPGSPQRTGTTVDLVLSRGKEPIPVPQVVGRTQDDAGQALEAAHLQVKIEVDRVFSDQPVGSVAQQSPATGTVHHGDTVKLTMSKGPEMVPVPDVRGQQVGPATQALQQQGFTVTVRKVLGGFFNTVRDQNPGGGSSAPKGSAVELIVV